MVECYGKLPAPGDPTIPVAVGAARDRKANRGGGVGGGIGAVRSYAVTTADPTQGQSTGHPPDELPVAVPGPTVAVGRMELSIRGPRVFIGDKFVWLCRRCAPPFPGGMPPVVDRNTNSFEGLGYPLGPLSNGLSV